MPDRIIRKPRQQLPTKPITRKKRRDARVLLYREFSRQVYEAKLAGFSYQQICDKLNQQRLAAWKDRPPQHANDPEPRELLKSDVWKLAQEYQGLLERESIDSIRWLHVDRTEEIFKALQGGIRAGNARSAEVALKALERQSQLLGLDSIQEKTLGVQPIAIIIGGHPGDPGALNLISQHRAEIGPALRPPIEGVLLPEAHNGAGGGDGGGEDFLRSTVDLEADRRSNNQSP